MTLKNVGRDGFKAYLGMNLLLFWDAKCINNEKTSFTNGNTEQNQ